MNKEDFENFQASFDHIDDILKVLVDELDQQLLDDHMIYSVQFGDDAIDNIDTKEKREQFLLMIIKEALLTSMDNALFGEEVDPWSRIKGFMALRQSKEEVQSPISAEVYEEIKVAAKKEVPLDLDSTYINNQRPEWTQEQQEALIIKKEKDESA